MILSTFFRWRPFWMPFLLFPCLLGAQQVETHARLKISLEGRRLGDLARLGIEIEHAEYKAGEYLISEYTESEQRRIRQAGFAYEVLIPDMTRWFLEQNTPPSALDRGGGCPGLSALYPYATPKQYRPGSLKGYFTYAEILANLDSMSARYPHLVSVRREISDSIATHDGHPIWFVRFSDNPDTIEQEEPTIFYNALHHAREANSVSQMLFFMWYLLERYDTDPAVKYLLDQTALYFAPVVNVDGYLYNEAIAPEGGGLWRKNRRPNGNGVFGVDLNRNYGYQWGLDNSGSSPDSTSEVYRGPAPFSEPETRMIRDFCTQYRFDLVLNYHTRGNYLIYPFSFNETPGSPKLVELGNLFAKENLFSVGTTFQVLNYYVNGSSDDWMFGVLGSEALTPEVGEPGYGFWPPTEEIERLNKSTLRQNLVAAYSLHTYAEATDKGQLIIQSPLFSIPVSVKRYGRKDGPFTVGISPLSPEITDVSPEQTINLTQFEEQNLQFTVSAQPFKTIRCVLWVKAGDIVVYSDTLSRVLAAPLVTVFADSGDKRSSWTTSDVLFSQNNTYRTPPLGYRVYTSQNNTPPATLKTPISIPSNVAYARLSFWAYLNCPLNAGYAVVESSTDGVNFSPICGKFTRPGLVAPLIGQPVYRGYLSEWRREQIDLSAFKGQNIWLRFSYKPLNQSSSNVFLVDDIEISYADAFVSTTDPAAAPVLRVMPNPVVEYADFALENAPMDGQLEVFDALGHLQAVSQTTQGHALVRINTDSWPAGTYFYRLRTERGVLGRGRIVKGE